MAQTTHPGLADFATGLESPIKLSLTERGSLLVSEHQEVQAAGRIAVRDRNVSAQGQPVPNSGRVRLLDHAGHPGVTVIDGLPISLMSTLVRQRTLFLQIGAWDAVLPGPVPGSEVPNPHPSSPILSSVLVLELPRDCDHLAAGFAIRAGDHAKLKQGEQLRLTNSRGEHATLRLLVDLPDYTPAPVPGVPNAVRGSNPFGIVEQGGALYMADAAQNTVIRVDVATGRADVLYTFPERPNPGGMPPSIDAVPDSIRSHAGRLLVPLLTGYPFPAGTAEVRSIGLDSSSEPFIGGLTSAIDVMPVPLAHGQTTFFVLEYSLDQSTNAPGRLQRFDTPAGPGVVLDDTLQSPTNLAYDETRDMLYLTEIFTGTIKAVHGVGRQT